MLGRSEEAIQGNFFSSIHCDLFLMASSLDLRAVLRLQPSNKEALAELASLIPLAAVNSSNGSSIASGHFGDDSTPSTSKQPTSESSSPSLSDRKSVV